MKSLRSMFTPKGRFFFGIKPVSWVIRKIEELSSQVHSLGRLLLEIYPRLDHESAEHVDQSLKKVRSVSGLPSKLKGVDEDERKGSYLT